MKKNNKGYMLIEIIIAAVIAFGIAYYLLNLTFKFSDKNMDTYKSINYLSDKNNVTKNIMNDLEKCNISDIENGKDGDISYVQFSATVENGESKIKRIEVDEDKKTVTYGNYDANSGEFNKDDTSYYFKKLSKDLTIGSPKIDTSPETNTINVYIPLTSNYDDQDYGIKLLINNYSSKAITSCIVDVSDGTSSNNSSNGWFGWGMWNGTYNNSIGTNYGYNYNYGDWSQYYNNYYSGFYNSNFWSQNTGSTEDDCKTEYSLANGNGMTYVVRFKYKGTYEAINIFGDNFNDGSFSGIYTDSEGNLHNSWNPAKTFKLTNNTWYTFVSVFTYNFTTGQNGYSFSSKFTLYLYNQNKDKCIDENGEEKTCSSSIEYGWSTSNNSLSSSSFVVNTKSNITSSGNEESTDTSTDTGVEVSDAIFYWKALNENLINKYFGYTETTNASKDGIDITSQGAINDGMRQRLIFHWKNG